MGLLRMQLYLVLIFYNLITRVNWPKYLLHYESCELNESVYVSLQKRNQIEFRCESKISNDLGSWINDYFWNPSRCNYEFNKAGKIDKYLDIRKCLCEKRLFNKLGLTYEDEVLNTAETLTIKLLIFESNCFIHTLFHC